MYMYLTIYIVARVFALQCFHYILLVVPTCLASIMLPLQVVESPHLGVNSLVLLPVGSAVMSTFDGTPYVAFELPCRVMY